MDEALKTRRRIETVRIRLPNWIGDVVMALPAVALVRHLLPEARLHLQVREKLADLARAIPGVFRVEAPAHDCDLAGAWRRMRAPDADLGLVFPASFRAAWDLFRSGARERAGYGGQGRSWMLTRSVPRPVRAGVIHQSNDYLDLVRAALGADETKVPSVPPVRFTVQDSDRDWVRAQLARWNVEPRQMLIGVHAGASYGPAKRWPADRFVRLIGLLRRRYEAAVVVLGDASERGITSALVRACADPAVIDAGGCCTLPQLLALLGACRVFVCNDSGPMHLASALGTPLVALFGSTDPRLTGPTGGRSVSLWKHPPCSPCFKRVCPLRTDRLRCLLAIEPDEAAAAVEKTIAFSTAGELR